MTTEPSSETAQALAEDPSVQSIDRGVGTDREAPEPHVRSGPGNGDGPGAKGGWRRAGFIILGIALFAAIYFAPVPAAAIDPQGAAFPLTGEGKAALALFFLAATWWVAEVVPIGVTSIAIAVFQALFLIRPARDAFTDFMDPSVWFIFASLMIGMVFTKTGLTRRVAYRMLAMVGERTSMIYLGCFVMTAGLTLIMAHTAVAATVYPLLLAVYALYTDDTRPTRFGKGLFMGMAFVAGAGSIITLLGAARGAVAIGFFYDITGRQIDFFQLTYYMLPVGAVMVVLLWVFFMLWYPPEEKTIPGLRERVNRLYATLGPISRNEIVSLALVLATIAVLGLRSFIPALEPLDKSAVLLVPVLLLFLLKVLSLDDLESASWNIVFLFGGAMSIGLCLWQTGAASWLAVKWLALFDSAHWLVFVLGIAAFVLVMTNLIMNVAAIAITMPVALVMAPYVGVAPDVVLFASLVTAGMPFLFLVGAAPNAIAYASGQFTLREFFVAGIPASLMLMVVLGIFVWMVWPLMGMPVQVTG